MGTPLVLTLDETFVEIYIKYIFELNSTYRLLSYIRHFTKCWPKTNIFKFFKTEICYPRHSRIHQNGSCESVVLFSNLHFAICRHVSVVMFVINGTDKSIVRRLLTWSWCIFCYRVLLTLHFPRKRDLLFSKCIERSV